MSVCRCRSPSRKLHQTPAKGIFQSLDNFFFFNCLCFAPPAPKSCSSKHGPCGQYFPSLNFYLVTLQSNPSPHEVTHRLMLTYPVCTPLRVCSLCSPDRSLLGLTQDLRSPITHGGSGEVASCTEWLPQIWAAGAGGGGETLAPCVHPQAS